MDIKNLTAALPAFRTALFLAGLAFTGITQANNVNPYSGTYDAESTAKRELAVLRVQTQIQQQKVEMKKEAFKLENVDKVMKAELSKQLRESAPKDDLAALDRLAKAPGRTPGLPQGIPAPQPEAVFVPPPPPPPMIQLDAVIRKDGHLAAIISRGGESVTVKAGDSAFGEKIGEVTASSAMLGSRKLTLSAMHLANADMQKGGDGGFAPPIRTQQGGMQRPGQPTLPVGGATVRR